MTRQLTYERSYLIRRTQTYTVPVPDDLDTGDIEAGYFDPDFDQYACDHGQLVAESHHVTEDDQLDGHIVPEPNIGPEPSRDRV